MKVLLAVDGSDCAIRATQKLIEMIGWYKETPEIELVTVQLPVPQLAGMHSVVTQEDLDGYYSEACAQNLGPSEKLLREAGIAYTTSTRIGAPGDMIVQHAHAGRSDMIFMGTHGRSPASAMVLGSVAMRVVHLAHIPVTLVR